MPITTPSRLVTLTTTANFSVASQNTTDNIGGVPVTINFSPNTPTAVIVAIGISEGTGFHEYQNANCADWRVQEAFKIDDTTIGILVPANKASYTFEVQINENLDSSEMYKLRILSYGSVNAGTTIPLHTINSSVGVARPSSSNTGTGSTSLTDYTGDYDNLNTRKDWVAMKFNGQITIWPGASGSTFSYCEFNGGASPNYALKTPAGGPIANLSFDHCTFGKAQPSATPDVLVMSTTAQANNWTFTYCQFRNAGGDCIKIDEGGPVRFERCWFTAWHCSSGAHGDVLQYDGGDCHDHTFLYCYLDDTAQGGHTFANGMTQMSNIQVWDYLTYDRCWIHGGTITFRIENKAGSGHPHWRARNCQIGDVKGTDYESQLFWQVNDDVVLNCKRSGNKAADGSGECLDHNDNPFNNEKVWS